MDTLASIHENQGIPVLVNLHHIDFAKHYGKRILGMSKGQLVFAGSPQDLTEETITHVYGAKLNEAFGELSAA